MPSFPEISLLDVSLSTVFQIDTSNSQGACQYSSALELPFRWNLYVIYTAGQQFARLAAANPVELYQQRFVVKYTYSFRP